MALKRRVGEGLALMRTRQFPASRTISCHGSHEAYLGIGGNIGDTIRRFERLLVYLERGGMVCVMQTSAILKNPPFGYADQSDFYNAVIIVRTHLTPKALLRYILATERRFKRKRLFKDGPRTLDIDILFYDDITIQSPLLTIPHPGWSKRDSVLIPLTTMKGLK